jgi:hypothetical protein
LRRLSEAGAPVDNSREVPGKIDRPRDAQLRLLLPLLVLAVLLGCWTATSAKAAPIPTRIIYAQGKIVPIPAAIPHEEGDMVDRRIVPDLRWIAARFPIYVTDGYSGPLPDGAHAGCHGCHVKHSDHYNGLAVDIVALNGQGGCDRAWRGITRLARWAEPRQNRPRAPFRWVGYNGDAGHGCGNHLHLSWEHALAPQFQLAEWVEVFPVRRQDIAKQPQPSTPPSGVTPPAGPQGGSEPGPSYEGEPRGGVSVVQSGGISARGD